MMVKVKICGITSVSDALMAARCGADALGFNFVKGSPRCISPETAKPILLSLPPFVATVGVFADSSLERIEEIMDFCGLGFVQLHGHESPRKVARLKGRRTIKAVRLRNEDDLKEVERYRVEAYVIDAHVPGLLGGTGQTVDWGLARAASARAKIILAGGLTPENVGKAVRIARPFGVDVASGVEVTPGQKSGELVERFVRNAKSVEL